MRTLIILRTHRADAETLAAYDRYAALRAADAVICCDERDGPVDMGGRAKIGFDAARLQALGLFVHPQIGRLCGDYAYYVTRAARPHYDFYWVTEPDVVINAADLDATFEALNASDADLLASRLDLRDARWGWSRTMMGRYADVFGCIFPLTRLTGRAIDHLHAARRAAPVPGSEEAVADWPNDEAFVATELMNNGFEGRDLATVLPGSYTIDTLRTGLPHDRARLVSRPPDGLIYHPVRDFLAWFDDKAEWLARYGRRARVESFVPNRTHMKLLLRIAAGALEQKTLTEAALLPLMLASRRSTTSPHFEDYNEKRRRASRMLIRTFGDGRKGCALATAYVLGEPSQAMSAAAAGPRDFPLMEPTPLFAVPVQRALPYASDFEEETLLFTVHARPEKVLSATSALEEQRRDAAVGFKVSWGNLSKVVPMSGEPVSAILLEEASDAATLRGLGYLPVVNAPALGQLLAEPGRLEALPLDVRSKLLWSAIARVSSFGRAVFPVGQDLGRLRASLEGMLPQVRIVRRATDLPPAGAVSAPLHKPSPHGIILPKKTGSTMRFTNAKRWSDTVKDYYPVDPRPRHGYGLPSHPAIAAILDANRPSYEEALGMLAECRDVLHSIGHEPQRPNAPTNLPTWNNVWFTALDAASLVAFLLARRPKRYLEIGSGNSTRFARFAIDSGKLPTELVSIDPQPRAEIDALCTRMVRSPLETCDIEMFADLEAGDILFFDGSHRVFTNSDVTVFFLEILPVLKPGVLVHIHDIFLPDDYPPQWSGRLYSEQYLLAAQLLAGHATFRIVLPNYYVTCDPEMGGRVAEIFRSDNGGTDIPLRFPNGAQTPGASFWLETLAAAAIQRPKRTARNVQA